MGGRFFIRGRWTDVPDGVSVIDWLNEIVAIRGIDGYLRPTGFMRRIEFVQRIRRSGRGRGMALEAIVRHFGKAQNRSEGK